MKEHPDSSNGHTTLGTVSFLSIIVLLSAIPFIDTQAQNPSSGTVGPSPGGPSAGWDQTITTPGGGVNTEATCVDGTNCEVFNLTVNGTAASWTNQKVQ